MLAAFVTYVPKAEAAVPTGGRSWELVTARGPTSARTFSVRALAGEDEKFVYSTFGPAPGSESGPFVTYLIGERGPTGWTETPISPLYSKFPTEILGTLIPVKPASFSSDLQTALWLSTTPLTADGQPLDTLGLYIKRGQQPLEFIAKIAGYEPLYNQYNTGFGFIDISSDGTRVVFTTHEHFLPADAGRTGAESESVYEWDGSMHLLNVDNGGNLLSECGARVSKANGMSAAANRVFFTVPATCGGVAKIYMRDLETDTTVQISASECTRGDCNAPQDAEFAGATQDGSAAFLTTKQQLTNDDHDSANDLYRYDTGTEELTLLSGGSEGTTGEVASGLVYPSDNGSHVYFRASGEVLPGEVTTGEKLFLADPSGVHLVAEASFGLKPGIQLSASGERAVFSTNSALLPSDTDAEMDVYLYDAEEEILTRISTGPSGGNGPTAAFISSPVERGEFESTGDTRPFYAIDASGDRIFFGTREQLVPEDINTKADVYEWWNGQLGLISSGEDGFDSGFVGVSRDGRTALIVTNASLLPADIDGGNRDFYAARIGGGFPEPEETPGCDISSCPPPSRERLQRPTPTSASPPIEKKHRLRVLGVRWAETAGGDRSGSVLVEAPLPGLVTASVWVREHGRKVVFASGSTSAARPGRVRVDLRVRRSGGKGSSGGAQVGHLVVREGDATVSQVVKVNRG
jgi:hypothetical protein